MKKNILFMSCILCCIFCFCGCSDVDNNHPMLKKAVQSIRMGEYRNAEICYKKYLEKNPKAASVHLALAQLYDEHLEEYLLAIYHYKEALRLQPDAGEETVRNIEGFIKRCEVRYGQKGKSVKKVFLTDEQEIERMTAAYKKKLVEQQKKADAELARLKKEAEEAEKESLQLPDAEKKMEKTVPVPENITGNAVSEIQASDSPVISEKNSEDSPIEVEKTEKTAEFVKNEEKKTDTVPSADNTADASAETEVIKDFSTLPVMQSEKKQEIQPEKKSVVIQEYKVKKGDTFTHLSRQFYGSIRYYKQLMEYNKITNPNSLRVGKTVKIPPLEILKGEKNEN